MISASVPSLHHCRRSTISFWKYPRWAIGPPNEVHPSRRKTNNTSAIDPRSRSDRRGRLAILSGTSPIVHRQGSGSQKGNRKEPYNHAKVRSSLVHRSPKTLLEEHWNFGCRDRNQNIDQQRQDGEDREQNKDQQAATHNLHHAHERSRELWSGNTDLLEMPGTKRGGKKELLNTFRQEHPAHEEA